MAQHYTLQDISRAYNLIDEAITYPRFSEERHEILKEYVALWKLIEPAVQQEFVTYLASHISVTQRSPEKKEAMIKLCKRAGPMKPSPSEKAAKQS